ncbi:MAG: hypothetical protein WC364_11010 [Eubacteriales bacterium]
MSKEQDKLRKWQGRLTTCMADYNEERYNDRELIYNGTHDVDPDINSDDTVKKQANIVVNAVYEFIEGMVDSTIPDVSAIPKKQSAIELARIAENMVKNIVDDLPMTRLNDVNERVTYIQGTSLFDVKVDEDGVISVDNPHIKNFLYPKGATEIEELDYFIVLYSVSKAHIKRAYGVDVESESEEYQGVRYFDTEQVGVHTDEKVTLCVGWEKDNDGDIGKFSWVNNTIIENLPRYYYRRIDVCSECSEPQDDDIQACRKCGTAVTPLETCAGCGQQMFGPVCQQCGQSAVQYIEPTLCTECGNDTFKTVCPICGSDHFKTKITDTEKLAYAVQTPYGMIPPGTEVPYFIPKTYPIVARINVPVNLQLEGQSDIDIVRDLQDALKKVVSTMVEKLIRGGTIIKALKEHKFELTNDLYQVVRGDAAELQYLGPVSLSGDIEKDLVMAQYLYQKIQDSIGITDAWLGKNDASARTGIAKQIQVQQSGGRLNSKYLNKNDSYGQLYRIIFERILAFDDEGGEYITQNIGGDTESAEYNRYMFLKPDGRNGWKYDISFVFRGVSGVEGLPKDKNWLLAQAIQLAQYQYIDMEQFWSFMQTINFPMSTKILQDVQKKMAEQKAMAAQQTQDPKSMNQDAILQHLPPEQQALFNSASKEDQQALLSEIAGAGSGGQ